MTTDTAHLFWDGQWKTADGSSKWARAEAEVLAHAATLPKGARILDLGAGIGRHALALAAMGFDVTALDASENAITAISAAAAESGITLATHLGPMTELPFPAAAFDHVLSWNVIYHGDEDVVRRTIAGVARVLRPGGSFLFTMLSARRIPVELARAPGREISRNTWVFEAGLHSDKSHPHYFCTARDLIGLLDGFELLTLADREHDEPGSWHWHVLAERRDGP